MDPIIEKYNGRFDPLYIYKLLSSHEKISFLLESQLWGYRYNRYSIIGLRPFLTFKAKASRIEIREPNRTTSFTGNPFIILKKYLSKYYIDTLNPNLPTTAAAVGYFGYDLKNFVEEIPDIAVDDLKLPDCYIGFYDTLLIFDNFEGCLYIVANCLQGKFSRPNRLKAKESIQKIKKIISKGTPSNAKYRLKNNGFNITSNFCKKDYIHAINRIKRYIEEGDIYQVNLSQRFSTDISYNPIDIYERLRHVNPAPFAAYLNFDKFQVISASPERFLKMDGNFIQTRPIKGTRPREKDLGKDNLMKYELLQSKKDRAELLMIIDLERNDLSRVCRFNSIKVPALFELETFPTLHHLVGTVEGILKKGRDHIDCLMASFPGGSITGAPKIMAMKIIEELEPTKRGLYTGSIGYIGLDRKSDLNIAIRTILTVGKKAYFHAGGGIVIDSDPQKEYVETLDKAKALFKALQ